MSPAAAVQSQLRIEFLRIDGIRPSPLNPRQIFKEIDDLAENIKARGIKVPLRVRPIAAVESADLGVEVSAHFELVFGERRLRAARKAGLVEVPAIVEEMSDSEALELMLVELAQTSDVHPIEEAQAYLKLHTMKRKPGDKGGMSVEEIALKVGKSKRTVYERLQLAGKATQLVKDASLKGDLEPSIAILVSRVPAQHQEAALKEVLEGEHGVGKMTFDEAHDHLFGKYMLGLADAPWDLKDEQLVQEAGSCTKCLKRTGNQPELFADVDAKDTCTDPDCFADKKKAFVKLTIEKAQLDGKPVMTTAKEAKKALKGGEYVELDKYDHRLGQTPRQALGKKKVETTLAPAPEGVQELLRREDLEKLLPKAAPEKDWQADEKKRQAEVEQKERTGLALIAASTAKLEAKAPGRVVLFIVASEMLREAIDAQDADEIISIRLGRPAGSGTAEADETAMLALLSKMNAEKLTGFIIEMVMHDALQDYVYGHSKKPMLREMADVLGVDEKKLAAQVKAETKEEEKAQEKASEPQAANDAPAEEAAPKKVTPAKTKKAAKTTPKKSKKK